MHWWCLVTRWPGVWCTDNALAGPIYPPALRYFESVGASQHLSISPLSASNLVWQVQAVPPNSTSNCTHGLWISSFILHNTRIEWDTDAQGFSDAISTEGGDSTCIKQRDGLIGTEFGTAPATKPPTGWRWAVWLQQEILRQKLCGKGLSLEGIMSIPLGREIWWIFMSFFLRMSCFSKISQAGTGRLRSQLRWHDNVATRRSACKGLMSNTFRKFCGAFANFISIHAIRF